MVPTSRTPQKNIRVGTNLLMQAGSSKVSLSPAGGIGGLRLVPAGCGARGCGWFRRVAAVVPAGCGWFRRVAAVVSAVVFLSVSPWLPARSPPRSPLKRPSAVPNIPSAGSCSRLRSTRCRGPPTELRHTRRPPRDPNELRPSAVPFAPTAATRRNQPQTSLQASGVLGLALAWQWMHVSGKQHGGQAFTAVLH